MRIVRTASAGGCARTTIDPLVSSHDSLPFCSSRVSSRFSIPCVSCPVFPFSENEDLRSEREQRSSTMVLTMTKIVHYNLMMTIYCDSSIETREDVSESQLILYNCRRLTIAIGVNVLLASDAGGVVSLRVCTRACVSRVLSILFNHSLETIR